MSPLAYIKLGIGAALVLALVSTYLYIGHLQSARDAALAANAALQATNNELSAVHANDVKALAELETAKAQAEAALLADATQQQAVVQTVTLWKEKIVHVPVANAACRAADARDAAVLDGVRHVIASTAAADPDPNRQDPAAGGALGGHPAAKPAGRAPNP